MPTTSLAVAGRQLDDEGLRDVLEKNRSERQISLLDFSNNRIGARGVRYLVDFALDCKYLTTVKLYKNMIGDDGAEELRPLMEKPTLRELHLSHNGIGNKGAEALLNGVRYSLGDRKELVLIRLEHNRIKGIADMVLDVLSTRSFCCRYDDKCTRRVCVRGRLIHLPLIWKQEHTSDLTQDKERDRLDGLSPSRSQPTSTSQGRRGPRSRSRKRSPKQSSSERQYNSRRSPIRRDRPARRRSPERHQTFPSPEQYSKSRRLATPERHNGDTRFSRTPTKCRSPPRLTECERHNSTKRHSRPHDNLSPRHSKASQEKISSPQNQSQHRSRHTSPRKQEACEKQNSPKRRHRSRSRLAAQSIIQHESPERSDRMTKHSRSREKYIVRESSSPERHRSPAWCSSSSEPEGEGRLLPAPGTVLAGGV